MSTTRVQTVDWGLCMSAHSSNGFSTIAHVAQTLGLTHRALRFYEGRGLVFPKRVLRTRLYSDRDIERLRLILKLKAVGLSILEIKELIKNPGSGPYGLNEKLCAELIERSVAQKLTAETALAELRQIASHFRPRERTPNRESELADAPLS